MNKLANSIEAILFWYGEPIAIKKVAKILGVEETALEEGVKALEEGLEERGLRIVSKDGEIAMVTAPDVSKLIESLAKEELSRDLGKAGLETIAIVLYQGPISRREIDYIRGVNSNFILRNLLVRGLVEKISNPEDERSFLYRPSFELLTYLGLGRVEELPQYEETRREIASFKTAQAEAEPPRQESQSPSQEHHAGN